MSNEKYVWIVKTAQIKNANHMACFDNEISAVACCYYYKGQSPRDVVSIEKVPLYVHFDCVNKEHEHEVLG